MTQVRMRGDREIVILRDFSASRQLVFDAYTKPELLRRWLGVRNGWTMDVCDVDLWAGGKYRWVWRHAAKSKEMGISGVYREIVKPERIVCTEKFDNPWCESEAINTIEFIEENGVTTLSITSAFETKEARDGAMQSGMETGMEESFVVLDALLPGLE